MSYRNDTHLVSTLGKLLANHPLEGAATFDQVQLERLLGIYYRHIPPSDLAEHEPQDLLGALIAHWRLMYQRAPDEAKARVYNPEQENHGWRSRDTIVEIVAADRPFLVDSISAALNRRGLAIKLTIHPVFGVARDADGTVTAIQDLNECDETMAPEAVIQMHIDRQPTETLSGLEDTIRTVLHDVTLATSDWLNMKQFAETTRDNLPASPSAASIADLDEVQAFLNWMINDHFLFIATCRFDLSSGSNPSLRFVAESALGVLGGDSAALAETWISGLGVDLNAFDAELLVTKTNARSTVHRPTYMDCVAVKRRDASGNIVGLDCLIGLFSSSAYSTPPRQIPLLRKKVATIFERSQVSPRSHSGRTVTNILDNFPRNTLFQIGVEDLLRTTLGVLSLQERQRTRLFVIRDTFRRFCTCIVYVPRDRYSRETRLAIQDVLVDYFDASDVVYETQFSESILARISFMLWVPADSEIGLDTDELEQRVIDTATTWHDGLREALSAQLEESLATHQLRKYGTAFPGGYREEVHPRIAVNDIQRIESARGQNRLQLHVYHPIDGAEDQLHVRLYSPHHPVSLSQAIPILEHMGLSVFGERPYRIRQNTGDIWIHDFATRGSGEISANAERLFVETFGHVWDGRIDNDGFNRLVLCAELSWKEAMMFRAYSRYLHQLKAPYTESYLIGVLNRHPDVIRIINRMFQLRFDPDSDNGGTEPERQLGKFELALERVSSLDEDRILRSLVNLVQATLRTNFYCPSASGAEIPYLSFKLDPAQINGMPLPRPMFEIFVFSTHMEGVHLRGGPVARGGLRWSDRMEDYRTEILGLMKAQMVKNTVIVPVGSKGGFVVKRDLAGDSRALQQEKVIESYKTLLRGMLDITDNLAGDRLVPPEGVVRHDADDPYLVIAADKGTATFSDIANQVSADYGFWLGDAFASGGSDGYDHKAMGITARGAWESVKRSFRELGHDTQTSPFTVMGIGDMSGDVFGNGMRLSPHIRLIGAFNHRHIFLDPDPDPASSFAERSRLFENPSLSWEDYDRRLISPGGGVFSRDAKSIPLSGEVKTMLGVSDERLTPIELIRALLTAPADLLWNGGIGTYIKASTETHDDASDKANDAVRVDATQLRCRVVGEGGNLGLTQQARIEFALRGGMVYTDAIDNSAGVDCSDHEVNIKILLDKLVAEGDLTTKQRNRLLVEMTDDVADLVLADNYAQTQAISVVAAAGVDRLYEQARFMDLLEQKGTFSRALESLPDRKAITERRASGKGLTKPEISVLLAYSKMAYFEAIVSSDLPDDPFVLDRLRSYFPPALRERFVGEIESHRLRREIVATQLAGDISNHVGPGIGFRVREEVGSDLATVAKAYLVVSTIFETDVLRRRIEALDNRINAAVQIEMIASISSFLEQALTALLRGYKGQLDMSALNTRFHEGVRELREALPRPLASNDKATFEQRRQDLSSAGVPQDLAESMACLDPLSTALDVVDVAHETNTDIAATAWVHSALNHTLQLEWIRGQITALTVQTHWHVLARTKLRTALNRHQRDLTAEVLRSRTGSGTPSGILGRWSEQNRSMLEHHENIIAEFKAGDLFDFAILSLVVAGIGELVPAHSDCEPDSG